MDSLVFLIIGGLVCSTFCFYIFLMFCFPEWVGITGSKTKKELAEEQKKREAAAATAKKDHTHS